MVTFGNSGSAFGEDSLVGHQHYETTEGEDESIDGSLPGLTSRKAKRERTYSGEYVYITMRHNLPLIFCLNYPYISPPPFVGTAMAVVESDLVVIEVRDIAPIAAAYPALHMRLAEFHSKRHARCDSSLVFTIFPSFCHFFHHFCHHFVTLFIIFSSQGAAKTVTGSPSPSEVHDFECKVHRFEYKIHHLKYNDCHRCSQQRRKSWGSGLVHFAFK